MEQLLNDLSGALNWLFGTTAGVIVLIIGILIYRNHRKDVEAAEKKRKAREKRNNETVTIRETKTTKIHKPK